MRLNLARRRRIFFNLTMTHLPDGPSKDNPYASELLVNHLMTEGSLKGQVRGLIRRTVKLIKIQFGNQGTTRFLLVSFPSPSHHRTSCSIRSVWSRGIARSARIKSFTPTGILQRLALRPRTVDGKHARNPLFVSDPAILKHSSK